MKYTTMGKFYSVQIILQKGVAKENILVLVQLAVRTVPTQSILTLHTFRVCRCTYSLKFICDSAVSTGRFCSHLWTCTPQWKL